MGSLFGNLTDDAVSEHEMKHSSTDSVETGTTPSMTDRPFLTRRELRAQREAAERASQDAGPVAEAAPTAAPAAGSLAEFDAILHSDAAPAEPVDLVAQAVVFDAHPESSEAPVAFLSDVHLAEAPRAAEPAAPASAPAVPHAPAGEPHLSFAAPVLSSTAWSPRTEDVASDRAGRRAAKRNARRALALRSATDSSRSSRTVRERITAAGVIVVVGGIFGTLTLPAYASHDAAGVAAAKKQVSSQTFAAGDSAAVSVDRDAFGVTSAADLRGQYANALKQKNMQAYLSSGARALGDDYPWAGDLTRGEGGGLSPLRYYYRECVDFVAWRLNRDAGSTSAPFKYDWSTLTPGNGNASGWKSAWAAHGWAMGSEPQVGAVAWFPANHVAYVSGVLGDGSVVLEEYNYGTDHMYDQRIVKPSEVAMFLYAPPR